MPEKLAKALAIVADEVRNLAGKSAEAASSTTFLIEQTIHAVNNGTKIATDTALSMNSVVEGTEKVTGFVEEIAQISIEQSDAIIHVGTGIDQISTVVQVNSAASEESAAASNELLEQAKILNGLVHHFKLKKEEE